MRISITAWSWHKNLKADICLNKFFEISQQPMNILSLVKYDDKNPFIS